MERLIKLRHIVGAAIMNVWQFIVYLVLRILPLQNKAVFANFNGRGLGDDPKYIAYSLHRISPKTKLIWLVNNYNINLPDFFVPAKIGSFKALYHIATSKCWCSNSRGTFRIPKRDSQFYIQTWHCTLGLKDSEGACPNLPLKWRRAAEKDSRKTDLMYSNNDVTVDYYRNYFYNPISVIKSDVPRVAFMKNNQENVEDKIQRYFKYEKGKKIVLYAPTFRNDKDLLIYTFDYDYIVQSLNAKFGDSYVLFLRLHPYLSNLSNNLRLPDNVINATNYPDMQELICAASILITDFSSCMFDMCFLRKPVFLYAQDFDSYIVNERDLIYDFAVLPFSISRSIDELHDIIASFDIEKYQSACDAFFTRIGLKDEGKGDDYLAHILYSKLYNEHQL